jgi:hypothetical protein
MTTVTTKKVPRSAYYRQVEGAMPPRGSGVYDLLQEAALNKDAYETFFDDFQGIILDVTNTYTAKNSTGATTVAASKAVLASTASTGLYAGFTMGGLTWTGGQNCMMQVKATPTGIAQVKFEIGFTGTVAGFAGCVNAIDDPTWTANTSSVIFAFDTDGTCDVWQAMAYSSAAPKKRILYNTRVLTASSATSATDTSASGWVANSLAGQTITCGTAPNLTRGVIASNSTTVATLAGGWSNGTPTSTATYVIANAPAGVVVPVAGTSAVYTVKIEGTTALFYINGIQVATIPAAVAATTTGLTPWLFAESRTANAILSVDYLWCMQSRRVTA